MKREREAVIMKLQISYEPRSTHTQVQHGASNVEASYPAHTRVRAHTRTSAARTKLLTWEHPEHTCARTHKPTFPRHIPCLACRAQQMQQVIVSQTRDQAPPFKLKDAIERCSF